MKNAVVAQMQHVMPEVAAQMCWSNVPEAGSLPPNFSFVEAREVSELGSDFLRVTFQGEDLYKHQYAAIHFRLVIPPPGGSLEWPTLAANGSVMWPDDPGAPNRPVYTARSINHATNTLVMDVYIHTGGRVTD